VCLKLENVHRAKCKPILKKIFFLRLLRRVLSRLDFNIIIMATRSGRTVQEKNKTPIANSDRPSASAAPVVNACMYLRG
jgi:hypothetical protein